VFAANRAEIAAVPGMPAKVADAALDPDLTRRAEREWERMQALGIAWLSLGEPAYPKALVEIPRPPLALTVLGALRADEPAVAVVGSRKCSPYGRQFASKLAADLARAGVCIVSGLARGIDAVAHEAALEVGGRTVAVLASGLANIYPPEHANLAARIVKQGALVSEAPLDGPPIGALFPLRNRIVSGLSHGVVIVEAAEKSGAISTAYHALEQNREVFAVPGRLDDPTSAGAIELLRKGATLVRGAKDVLEQLGPIVGATRPPAPTSANRSPPTASTAMPPGLSDAEAAVWQALGVDGLDSDTLAERTGVAPAQLAGMLLVLEMRGVVVRKPGNRFARA
jgi:DNA processing protein